MWIPDKLYRKMPLVYALGGTATLTMFGTFSIGAVSSVLLFAAAATTFAWRKRRPLIGRHRRPGALTRQRL